MPLLSKFLENARSSASPVLDPMCSWAAENPRVAVTLTIAVAASTLYVIQRIRAPRLPPGPMPLPIVGNILSLTDRMHVDFARLREKYGDIFTVYFGRRPLIMMASYDTYKEAFLSRGNDFAIRPPHNIFGNDLLDDELFSAPFDEKWAKNKKFIVTNVRTLSGSKGDSGGSITTALSTMIRELRKVEGQPVDVNEICMLTATNAMSGMFFNENFEHDDPKLLRLVERITTWYTALNSMGWIAEAMPAWLFRLLSKKKLNDLANATADLQCYVEEQVKEHLSTYDPQHPRDLVDMYLGKPDLEVGRKMFQTIITFMPDSTDTMSIFMRWIVLYVTLHPQVLERLQREIDTVVAPNEMVTIGQRTKLPYTEAVLLEVIRCSDCSNFSTFHCATHPNTKMRGYDIPQNVAVMGSIYGVHKDPKLFPNPEKFDPERFLDDNGSVINSNLIIPWSIGRRMCPGESMSKTELFLFLANIVHTFNLRFPEDQPSPSTEPDHGFLQKPQPYKVIITSRE